jgi:hypothetical protein
VVGFVTGVLWIASIANELVSHSHQPFDPDLHLI